MNDKESMKRVVGLKYRPDEIGVPQVVLKGAGGTAGAILEAAEKQPVKLPVVQDKKLLDRLFRLPVDAPIDPDLFELVAVLLVHIYAVDEGVIQQRRKSAT